MLARKVFFGMWMQIYVQKTVLMFRMSKKTGMWEYPKSPVLVEVGFYGIFKKDSVGRTALALTILLEIPG